jgi:undecaprenyl-diphosphatase
MDIIEIIKAVVFGIVEGITEWLPISSTGHMILLESIWQLNVSKEFMEMFRVVIQLGAIMAVVLFFWKKLWPFGYKNRHISNVNKNQRKLFEQSNNNDIMYLGNIIIKKNIFVMWFKILVACVPAAVIGLLFDEKLEELFYNYKVVSIMLILFGILFIAVEYYNEDKKPRINSIADITYTIALLIGIFQVIAAVFPGVSRSGATILGALLIGVSRTVAAEFTFYLAVPVMFGASLLKIIKFGFNFTKLELAILLIGMFTAFIVSVFIIKFLLAYIKKHDFKVFGWYRIILGVIVIAYFTLR